MSKFLDELFDDLDKPENETPVEVETETHDIETDTEEVEEKTKTEESEAEEIADTEETTEASEETETSEDDDTELTPAEKKAYGRLKALQDERTKRQSAEEARKAAEAERDRLNEQLAEMHRKQRESAAQNLPDPYSDPDGYIAAREAQYQESLIRQSLGFSLERAVAKYGETEVEEAARWFETQINSNPHIPLRENMLSQADQMEYVLSSYKQAKQMTAYASGDVSHIVAELQKQGYQISKADTSTATAPAAPVNQPAAATTATAKTAPAAPKRSVLAGSSGATTASPSTGSMLDSVMRR